MTVPAPPFGPPIETQCEIIGTAKLINSFYCELRFDEKVRWVRIVNPISDDKHIHRSAAINTGATHMLSYLNLGKWLYIEEVNFNVLGRKFTEKRQSWYKIDKFEDYEYRSKVLERHRIIKPPDMLAGITLGVREGVDRWWE